MRYSFLMITLLITQLSYGQLSLWYIADQTPITANTYIVPDADSTKCVAWLIAKGETPTTNDKAYLGELIHELKGQRCPGITYIDTPLNVWDSISVYYPMALSSSTAHALNIKDTSVTYQLTYTGSPTHTSNGIAFNGTSQWSDTHFIPTVGGLATNSISMGVYINGGTGGGAAFPSIMGNLDSLGSPAPNNTGTSLTYRTGAFGWSATGNSCNGVSSAGGTFTPQYIFGAATSGYITMYFNGAIKLQTKYNNSGTCTISACSIALGALNNTYISHIAGTSQSQTYQNIRMATVFIGKGMGPSQIRWVYDCMYTYNTINLLR